jgi:cell wall-associated NlpC family hydrolase
MVQAGAVHKDVVELSLNEDELQPGDMICFRAGHVSAYLGAGLMVGSRRSGVQVRRILDQFPHHGHAHPRSTRQRFQTHARRHRHFTED